MIGSQYANLSNNPDPTASGFQAGRCGMHFIDYQIPNDDPARSYYIAAGLVDNAGAQLDDLGNPHSKGEDRVPIHAEGVTLKGPLPNVVTIYRPQPGSSNDSDDAPLSFNYQGTIWSSSDPQCSTGGFDGGSREGDCTFTC